MKRINDLPIRSKFIILFALGVLLPICILLFYVLTNTTAQVRERERMNAVQSLDRVYTTLETQFNSAIALGNAVSADTTLLSLARQNYPLPWKYYYAYYTEIRPTFNRYLTAFAQQVTNLQIYSFNETMFSGGYCMSLAAAKDEPWMPENVYEPISQLVSYVRRSSNGSRFIRISVVRTILSDRYPPILVKVDLWMEPIHAVVEGETKYMDIYLISPSGYVASCPGSRLDGVGQLGEIAAPEDCELSRVFGEKTAMNGWQLKADINEAPVVANVRKVILFGLLLGVLCTALAGALCLIMSHSIVDRSKRLLHHMDSLSGEHFEPLTRDAGRDEIGELIEHFNAMSERMRQLIQNIYVLELRQKNLELERVRAELKYLQAQIDPHFLFNTLNAILVLCVRNGYAELADVIRALSKILRRMIDTSRDMVPLREELEFVKMVLLIERFRFGDKLRYELDADVDTLDCPVPVMSVQALVENACKHGVQHISRQGLIRIQSRIRDGFLYIDVVDNGAGITPERLRFLQEHVRSSEDIEGSVGLQNIDRRLVLHYGELAGLNIENAPEQGTAVGIRIPLKGGRDDAARDAGGRRADGA